MTRWKVEHGDSRNLLKLIPDNSIDSIVTDPPYELGFMGKSWDATGIAYNVDLWRECLRILKPGGHILAFGGSRTYHRLASAIEDAGFEIRDQIMWVYGSGFPKSLDVSKAIDKQAGAERQIVSQTWRGERAGTSAGIMGKSVPRIDTVSLPTSDSAKQWQGWGTALKPAHEPIVLARKPLDGTVAQNVIWYGTGALNIDGCRVAYNGEKPSAWFEETERKNVGFKLTAGSSSRITSTPKTGRFPANLIHDGSDEVLQLFPEAGGGKATRGASSRIYGGGKGFTQATGEIVGYGDSGSAARFFYCAKANKTDRNEGLDDFAPKITNEITPPGTKGSQSPRAGAGRGGATANHHPTVKPTILMRYLVRLITPPDGTVLDPFTGSGSTGKAAILEGFRFHGIEQDPDYVQIARARIGFVE